MCVASTQHVPSAVRFVLDLSWIRPNSIVLQIGTQGSTERKVGDPAIPFPQSRKAVVPERRQPEPCVFMHATPIPHPPAMYVYPGLRTEGTMVFRETRGRGKSLRKAMFQGGVELGLGWPRGFMTL